MSRIFRFEDLKTYNEDFRTIEIQEFFSPQENVEEDITLENIFEERNKLLNDAHQEIQSQKDVFEQQCMQERQALQDEKNKWLQEKIELQKQVYDEGFQQGLEEGRLKAEANMAEDIKMANNTIIQSKINAEQYLQEQEEVILEIAIRSAEKILGITLEDHSERFIDIVRKGLKEAREMKEIKLYVSPLYHQLVSEHHDELREMFPPGVPFMIFVNEDIGDTDCYIETNHGRIIVSIDQQLKELRSKLGEILESVD